MILIWFNLLKIFEITSVCKFNFETRTQETIQTSIPSRHSNKEKYFHFLIPSPPRPRTLYFCLAVVQSENSDHYCRRQDPGPGWRAFNGNFLFRLIDGKWPRRIRDITVEIYQKMASQIISQRKSFASLMRNAFVGVQRNPLIVTGVQGIGKILNFPSRC